MGGRQVLYCRLFLVRQVGERVASHDQGTANMALFLCSEASSWITGQTNPVNGGYSLAL
jgi:2-hydroxycyclohexanecarboxyl-CoA dehydrogenase